MITTTLMRRIHCHCPVIRNFNPQILQPASTSSPRIANNRFHGAAVQPASAAADRPGHGLHDRVMSATRPITSLPATTTIRSLLLRRRPTIARFPTRGRSSTQFNNGISTTTACRPSSTIASPRALLHCVLHLVTQHRRSTRDGNDQLGLLSTSTRCMFDTRNEQGKLLSGPAACLRRQRLYELPFGQGTHVCSNWNAGSTRLPAAGRSITIVQAETGTPFTVIPDYDGDSSIRASCQWPRLPSASQHQRTWFDPTVFSGRPAEASGNYLNPRNCLRGPSMGPEARS